MEKNIFKKIMLLSVLGLFAAGTLTFVSCGSDDPDIPSGGGGGGGDDSGGGGGGGGSTNKDPWANLVNEDKKTLQIDGNTATYGNHTYTIGIQVNSKEDNFSSNGNAIRRVTSAFSFDEYNKNAKNWVSFTNIPSGYTEFKDVYEKFLGLTAEGCIAMLPMAMEIYGRNHETGKKCIELLCTPTCASSSLNIIKTKIKWDPKDSYAQRYLPAALLEEATYSNAYKPNEPYTVQITANPNKKNEELTFAGSGTVLHALVITSGGWDSYRRMVSVIRMPDSQSGPYKIFNYPDLYVQCRNIRGTWAGLK